MNFNSYKSRLDSIQVIGVGKVKRFSRRVDNRIQEYKKVETFEILESGAGTFPSHRK